MSIIITIKNNRDYCREKDMAANTRVPCQCTNENGTAPAAGLTCQHCEGQGYTELEVFPFELNVAETNFETLWNVLSLDPTAVGLDPRRILKALRKTTLSLMIRGGVKQGNTVYCGISPAQAARYKVKLTEMCEEAARREEKVIWG